MADAPPEPVMIPATVVRRWMLKGFLTGLALGIAAVVLVLVTR